MSRARYFVTAATLYADGSQSYQVRTPSGLARVTSDGHQAFYAPGPMYRPTETRYIKRAIARWRALWGGS